MLGLCPYEPFRPPPSPVAQTLMTCPDAPNVHAYHDSQLQPAQRFALESHLAECDACSSLLNDLREISLQVAAAPLPDVPFIPFDRYYDAMHLDQRRGVLRISSWLTAAAAAVLLASLVLFPPAHTPVETATAARPNWEPLALMAPVLTTPGQDDQLVEVAQWIANDLAN